MQLIKTSEIAKTLNQPLAKVQRLLRDSDILPVVSRGNAYWWAPGTVEQVRGLIESTRTYTRKQIQGE